MSTGEPFQRAFAEGAALRELGRLDEAAAAFGRAVAADPESARALTELALVELEFGRPKDARATVERALAIDAEYDRAYRVLARVLLAIPGAEDDARRAALRSVELVPEGFRGYIVLTEALLACGDTPGALAAAGRGVRLAPEQSGSHATLARALLRAEQWPAAEASGREALRLDPGDAGALNNLAVAVQRQGRTGEAVPIFEQASRADPGHATVRQNIRRIGASHGRRRLSPPARALVADEARARRYRPARWDWSRIGRFRPFWWILLKRVEAPKALAINTALFALGVFASVSSSGGAAIFWTALFAIGLPFSGLRTWRWWRVRHPPADSWRPSDPDDPAPRHAGGRAAQHADARATHSDDGRDDCRAPHHPEDQARG